MEYSREFQARAAEELVLLPRRSAVAEMMSAHTVMRDQVRVCRDLTPRQGSRKLLKL